MDEDDRQQPIRALSTVERAYALARNGPCTSLDDIRRQLERERYPSVNAHLSGPSIRRDLRQICRNRLVAASSTASASRPVPEPFTE
jgi:hypothetical protein